jgi:hypothetical protein
MDEEWRTVSGWGDAYEASSLGRIRRRGRVLRLQPMPAGYLRVNLSWRNRRHGALVHRLVYLAFHGPIPVGREINHRDSRKDNNRPDNLEAVTRSENLCHASSAGLAYRGELNHAAILSEADVRAIRRRYRPGGRPGYKALAHEFGVSWEAIREIIKGRAWGHVAA